jgi:hypothetical protein
MDRIENSIQVIILPPSPHSFTFFMRADQAKDVVGAFADLKLFATKSSDAVLHLR